jgi:hypothetical protein
MVEVGTSVQALGEMGASGRVKKRGVSVGEDTEPLKRQKIKNSPYRCGPGAVPEIDGSSTTRDASCGGPGSGPGIHERLLPEKC